MLLAAIRDFVFSSAGTRLKLLHIVLAAGVVATSFLFYTVFWNKPSEQTAEVSATHDAVATDEEGVATEPTPILLRIFKNSADVEIWEKRNGKYQHAKSLSLCKRLKAIGPKASFSDGIAPEGFYHLPADLIRWSAEKRPNAIPTGFPNTYDLGRAYSGGPVYLAPGCNTNALISMPADDLKELRARIDQALKGGQSVVPIHIYPFPISWSALREHKKTKNYSFWLNLKQVYDFFEEHHDLPAISVCGQRYMVAPKESEKAKEFETNPECIPLLPGSEVPHKVATRFSWLKQALLDQGIAYWTTKRAIKDIEVKCNLKRPACRRWYSLRKKMIENGKVPREFR